MPNEPRNKHGRTLREQLKAAADATAQQQRAKKENVAAKDKGNVTRRRASKEQVSAQQEHDQKKRDKSKREVKASLKDLKPLEAARGFIGNLALGWRILAVFVASVLIIGVVLYPIGCTYYQALRQEQQLQAVLDAVNERNESIESKNQELETDEGVENQAREEYGWVKDGEHATLVSNSGESSSGMPSQVDESQIEPPHTWYYDILDVIFQSKV